MKKQLLFFFLVISCTISMSAQDTWIHCGTLIDGISDKKQDQITIQISDDRIVDIQKGFSKVPDGDKLIDLSQMTVLPGLIDMHVHIEQEIGKDNYMDRFTKNDAEIAFEASVYAKRTLMAGFTTIRDLGGRGVNNALRDAIARGYVDGPRIFSAGKAIASTGGHADPTNGWRKSIMGDPGPREGVINGPDDARKAVRQRYKDGSDVIKITATGGVISMAKDGKRPQMTYEEIKAIVETANDYDMITAAHAHGPEGMKRAVEAGITTIEHGTIMTEEVMELMKKHGTYYVPTITAGNYVSIMAKVDGFYPDLVVPKALEIGPQLQKTFGLAYKAGVNIAFGTDAGVFPHGENAREFSLMVNEGMPAMEAIQSATSVAAKVLKVQDSLGSLEKDKMADIIAVKGDPLKDISLLENVEFVMKEGVVYKQP